MRRENCHKVSKQCLTLLGLLPCAKVVKKKFGDFDVVPSTGPFCGPLRKAPVHWVPLKKEMFTLLRSSLVTGQRVGTMFGGDGICKVLHVSVLAN